jgi:hypothetical protein
MKKLLKTLKSMYNEGGEGNYLIIAKDPYYLQINGGKKTTHIFIDGVNNTHLDEKDHLSEDQITQLKALGFEIEPRSGNFSKELPFSNTSLAEIDEFIIKALDLYQIDPYKAEFELELE